MLKTTDTEIYNLIEKEKNRQNNVIEMIPSENYASNAVLEAVGSVLMNKYSEGYPKKRYYQGNNVSDEVETLALERAKKLFGVPHANVQPYSGSPANAAVYFALLNPGDTIMGMSLSEGGHLTHGHPGITFSGKYFKSEQYGVSKDGLLDFGVIKNLAHEKNPKIIISGATAYPREFDFKKFGEIAMETGAYHLADISHIAGLVAAGVHESPVPYADVVMFTTHKTLRGPRGAVILVTDRGLKKDPELASKIDKAVFPGLQGGPHNNITAAIAVCLKEAMEPGFRDYAIQTVKNAQTLARELSGYGFNLVSGGTDNHLLLIDLTNKEIDGWCAAWALEYAGIVLNRNTVPFDTKSAFYPSGIRLGTPIVTTRGMKEKEMVKIAGWINETVESSKKYANTVTKEGRKEFKVHAQNDEIIKRIAGEVEELCKLFPTGYL